MVLHSPVSPSLCAQQFFFSGTRRDASVHTGLPSLSPETKPFLLQQLDHNFPRKKIGDHQLCAEREHTEPTWERKGQKGQYEGWQESKAGLLDFS